jgi:hypothetical protein
MMTELCQIDIYAAHRPDDIGFLDLAPAERSLAPAPAFIFGPVPGHLSNALFGGLGQCAMGLYTLRNGRLAADGLPLHRDTALWSIALNQPEDHVGTLVAGDAHAPGERPIRHLPGRAACIFGPGCSIYGHWLVDFLPRLYVLQQAGHDILRLNYILPHQCPGFGLELLRLIGIPAQQLIPYDPACEQIQADELLLPTTLRTGSRLNRHFAAATRAWTNRLPHLPPQDPLARQRLFISRAGVASERILRNRARIEELAVSAGFTTVRPETLNRLEQIRLFRTARQVIGEYGSGLHGTIFGPTDLHCCALRGTSHWLGFIQSGLAHAFGQRMSYVFGEADAHARSYSFDIYEEDFKRALDCLSLEQG